MPIKALNELPLLRFRSVPSTLTLQQKAEFVRHEGLPATGDPQYFVETMQRWERALGTTHASLAGMIMMSGSPSVDHVIEGFKVFHAICNKLSPLLGGTTLNHLQNLFDHISKQLIFDEDGHNMLEGLQSFRNNLEHKQYLYVGDCVVCTAIFSLLYSFAGGMSGEAHTVNNPHTTAFFEPHGYCYESVKHEGLDRDVSLKPATNKIPLVISGIFSFLSTMAIAAILKIFDDTIMLGGLPKNKLEAMLQSLALAETVNPFHIEIYWKKRDLLWALRRGKEAKFDEIYEALGNLGQKPMRAEIQR